jgi:hypothetical protein
MTTPLLFAIGDAVFVRGHDDRHGTVLELPFPSAGGELMYTITFWDGIVELIRAGELRSAG